MDRLLARAFRRAFEAHQAADQGVLAGVRGVWVVLGEESVEAVFRVLEPGRDGFFARVASVNGKIYGRGVCFFSKYRR